MLFKRGVVGIWQRKRGHFASSCPHAQLDGQDGQDGQVNNPDGQDYISAPHRNQKSVSGMGVNIMVSDHLKWASPSFIFSYIFSVHWCRVFLIHVLYTEMLCLFNFRVRICLSSSTQ